MNGCVTQPCRQSRKYAQISFHKEYGGLCKEWYTCPYLVAKIFLKIKNEEVLQEKDQRDLEE